MNTESSNVYVAMRAYVETAMRLLSDLCPEGPPTILRGLDDWRRDGDVFRLHDREDPYWVTCIQANSDRLHSLPEFGRVVEALRNTPYVSDHLDTLVGTVQGARRVETAEAADVLLWRLAMRTGILRFDSSEFDDLFRLFEADFQRTTVSTVVVAPLLGLSADRTPIRLEPDTEIDNLTDEEIVVCLMVGLLPRQFGPSVRMLHLKSQAGVRVRYELPKVFGSAGTVSPEQALRSQMEAIGRATNILHALRLFKEGRCTVPGFVSFPVQWPLEGFYHFQYSNPGLQPWFNKFELHTTEADEFVTFWMRFSRVATSGALGNAARRFAYASDRERDDDRLVDLMIAAESLFLSDAGPAQERGELRFRLALRAGFFIDEPAYLKRQIFKFMRRAYDVRSAIVHGGGEPDHELLKSPIDEFMSFHDFTVLTERLLRTALKKGIDMAKTPEAPMVDWDSVIMPS